MFWLHSHTTIRVQHKHNQEKKGNKAETLYYSSQLNNGKLDLKFKKIKMLETHLGLILGTEAFKNKKSPCWPEIKPPKTTQTGHQLLKTVN